MLDTNTLPDWLVSGLATGECDEDDVTKWRDVEEWQRLCSDAHRAAQSATVA